MSRLEDFQLLVYWEDPQAEFPSNYTSRPTSTLRQKDLSKSYNDYDGPNCPS